MAFDLCQVREPDRTDYCKSELPDSVSLVELTLLRRSLARLGIENSSLLYNPEHGDTDFHKAFGLALGYLKHGV